ncbi:MAG: class I SAM-dependent methyltransferase, partial [Desulfomonile tiedjei]|nr:class I SAM-dependent methyltransferase [Desulfomonile tiedjei]
MCMACGFLYQSPRPTKALLTEIYRNSYRPAEPAPAYLAVKRADAEDKVAWLSKHLGGGGNGRRVLDIGSGEGSLLRGFQQAGWAAYGTEVTESFAKWGEKHFGVTIHAGELDESVYQGARFELVTLSHVLEHIHEPWDFLATVKGRMATGGNVFVEVPDFLVPRGSLSQNLFASPHLWGFSTESLCEVMRKAGFNIMSVERLVSIRGNVIRLLGRIDPERSDTAGSPTFQPHNVEEAFYNIRWDIRRHQAVYFMKGGWKDLVKGLLNMRKSRSSISSTSSTSA